MNTDRNNEYVIEVGRLHLRVNVGLLVSYEACVATCRPEVDLGVIQVRAWRLNRMVERA